ncbi:MAG: hypothetical protein ACXVZV_06845 [Terriglobales bacterium]
MGDVVDVNLRRKVLLFDQDHRRREIRAANLRTRGLDVLCARNLQELRDFWHIHTFRLVLLEASDCPDVVKFSEEVRLDDPRQRLAFFVGKPNYLAFLPVVVDDTVPPVFDSSAVSVEEAFKTLSNKNGFMEASLRMQLARSARRGATTVRPAKDPWAALRETPDAD